MTVASCFVYKVIRDLQSIAHVCINPISRKWLLQIDLSLWDSSSGLYKLMFYFKIVNIVIGIVTLGRHDSTYTNFYSFGVLRKHRSTTSCYSILLKNKKMIRHMMNDINNILKMKNSKWVWSGNTTITNRRQPHDITRKSHSTITRHQEDKLSKASSSLFPIKMIAILEWT